MAITPHFPLLGEPLSLDLVNTRIRSGGTDVDLLDAPAALATWLAAESGRLSWSGAVSAADLRAVRTLRDAIAKGSLPGPRILTSAEPLIGRGEQSGTPDEIRAFVRKQKEAGADLIKIFAAGSVRRPQMLL